MNKQDLADRVESVITVLLSAFVLYLVCSGIYILLMLPYYLVKIGEMLHHISYDPNTQMYIISMKF